MTTGNYYIDRGDEGQARVRQLAERLDGESIRRLETIGVGAGWHCLEIGPGAGTMTDWFCRRVSPTGHVVAIDLDTQNLERLDHANLEIRKADIVAHELEQDTFDLIFARAVLAHIPEREAVLDKLAAALRPGGWLFVIDPDQSREAVDAGTPRDLVERYEWLRRWRHEARTRVGIEMTLGLRHARSLRARGLERIAAEATQTYSVGATDAITYFRRNDEAYLRPLARTGEFSDAELDRALTVYSEPDFAQWGPMVITTWGRRPPS